MQLIHHYSHLLALLSLQACSFVLMGEK